MRASGVHAPYRLGPHRLPNRILMAPLTRYRAGPGGVPPPLSARYYAQRASAGLIIAEAARVSEGAGGSPRAPGIYTSDQVLGWRRVTQAVHGAGGRIFLQLWHPGRVSLPALRPAGGRLVAPCEVRPRAYAAPRGLESEEVARIVACFSRAAERAMQADFDGVELHAANGCLIDQFLRDGSNRRRDAYGGPPENRVRLLLELTRAASRVWGPDRVGVRLSPAGTRNDMRDSDPMATFTCAARRLGELGIAYLHVVETNESGQEVYFYPLRKAFGGTYIANGGYDRVRAEAAVTTGYADLIAFGRLFLANPDLPERLACGAPLNRPDPATFYAGGARGYIDYPTLARTGPPARRVAA